MAGVSENVVIQSSNGYLNRFIHLKYIRIMRIIRRYFHPYVDVSFYLDCFRSKKGIEIGGPSDIFSTLLPIYSVVDSIDNINHCDNNIWKNNSTEQLSKKFGRQFICETTDIKIPDDSYDFIISSHCLEHTANPLKALGEWLRIIKRGAYLLLIVPDKRYTFDHLRPITSFDHLLNDYESNVGEDDLTHVQEIVNLHDEKLDCLSKRVGWSNNFETRRMHHHVFDESLLKRMAEYFNLDILKTNWIYPNNIIMLARKRNSP